MQKLSGALLILGHIFDWFFRRVSIVLPQNPYDNHIWFLSILYSVLTKSAQTRFFKTWRGLEVSKWDFESRPNTYNVIFISFYIVYYRISYCYIMSRVFIFFMCADSLCIVGFTVLGETSYIKGALYSNVDFLQNIFF